MLGSQAVQSWFGGGVKAQQTAWDACMLVLLDADCTPAAEYVRNVAKGTRPIGLLIMPAYLKVT